MQKEHALSDFHWITLSISPMSFSTGLNKQWAIYKKVCRLLLFLLLLLCSCSCSIFDQDAKPKGAVLINSVRGAAPMELQKVPISMNIAELRKAQGNVEINQLRIIKIVLSASPSGEDPLPQYRIFNIKPGSVAQLLGLHNADILVAANGYVVYYPEQFMRYLASLPIKEGTHIEIRRDGRPMLIEYSFIGVDPWTNEQVQSGVPQKSEDEKEADAAMETMKGGVVETALPVLNHKEIGEVVEPNYNAEPKASKTPAPTAKKTSVSSKKKSSTSKKKPSASGKSKKK